MANRKVADCREMPSESNCEMTIAGPADEVLDVAVDHAVKKHGRLDTPEFREQIMAYMKDEPEEMDEGEYFATS